jgi:hypothetical protein
MWTGLFLNPSSGRPMLFGSVDRALRHLRRYPAWGRNAVEVRPCTRKDGESANGKPNFYIGDAVASGVDA